MATYKKVHFYETLAGIKARQLLVEMNADASFKTEAYFSANVDLHPDHRISFVDKHMEYLRAHPSTDPEQYISNLRLMTRIKRKY
jgi:hypothetical protein